MNEKMYKTITNVAAGNLVLGIAVLVTGIAAGVILIINGAKLLKCKSNIMF